MNYKYITFIGVNVPRDDLSNAKKLKKFLYSDKSTLNSFQKQYLKEYIKQCSCFDNIKFAKKDAGQRLDLFFNYLRYIYNYNNINRVENVLKIIVFPEFLFRPFFGAYTLAQAQLIVSCIRDFLKLPQWKDYLVFYTIFSAAELGESSLNNGSSSDDEKNYEIYNCCVTQQGNCGEEGTRFVLKEHLADSDTLLDDEVKRTSPELFNDLQLSQTLSYYNCQHLISGKFVSLPHARILSPNYGANQEQQANGSDGSGRAIFDMQGLKFGVEICIDHAYHRLRQSINDTPVQIQIIPAAGQRFIPTAAVVPPGGYVFNNDCYKGCRLYLRETSDIFKSIEPLQIFEEPYRTSTLPILNGMKFMTEEVDALLYGKNEKIKIYFYPILPMPSETYGDFKLQPQARMIKGFPPLPGTFPLRYFVNTAYNSTSLEKSHCNSCNKAFASHQFNGRTFYQSPTCACCFYSFCENCLTSVAHAGTKQLERNEFICSNCVNFLNSF